MHHEVVIEEVAPRIIAVARGRATAATLTATIGRLYDALHASGCATQTGANVVVYRDVGDRKLLHSVEGVPVEAGFEVMSEFEPQDDVVVSTTTPSGRV